MRTLKYLPELEINHPHQISAYTSARGQESGENAVVWAMLTLLLLVWSQFLWMIRSADDAEKSVRACAPKLC